MLEAHQERPKRKLILAQETVRVLNATGADIGGKLPMSGNQTCPTAGCATAGCEIRPEALNEGW